MKKIISFALTAIVLFACVLAPADSYSDMLDAEVRNARLDAAFENDKLKLVPTSFPSISAEDFEFPDEMWEALDIKKYDDPMDWAASFIRRAEIEWLSLSPAGNSGLLMANETVICYHNGKYRMMYPSRLHGVDDANGNLAKVFSIRMQTLLNAAGVVYSPDGRYAAVCNYEYTVSARYFLDPIIIDLSTGEMILTATYGNNVQSNENAGAVTTATFSSDGLYFYYMLYGSVDGFRTALYRYDMNAHQTELCYLSNNLNFYPRLSETKAGAFIIVCDTTKVNEPLGITQITYENISWSAKAESFDMPMLYWIPNRLQYSWNTDCAVLLGANGFSDGACYGLQFVKPDESFYGIHQYYAISKNHNELLCYSANEMMSIFDELRKDGTAGSRSHYISDLPFQIIWSLTVSPDGHYVLVATTNSGTEENPTSTRHLYLIRLDDLAMKEVDGIDLSTLQVGGFASDYTPVIEWNTDTLIIGTSGGTKAYQFQAD